MRRRTFLALLGLTPAAPLLAKLPSPARVEPIERAVFGGPVVGMYYFTGTGHLFVYDGATWRNCSMEPSAASSESKEA